MRAPDLARDLSPLCGRTALLGCSPRSACDHANAFHAPAFFASMHPRGFVQREITRRPVACSRGEA